ncbi:hypothetical protein [Salipiger abyssi]|nr:hypothetical protein [Salipiger abyssi]
MNDSLAVVDANFQMAQSGTGTGYLNIEDTRSLLDFTAGKGRTFHTVEAFLIHEDGGMQLDLDYSLLGLESEGEMLSEDITALYYQKLAAAEALPVEYLFKIWI